jgi:glycosyltransferase involved in cell wall biosynthesis
MSAAAQLPFATVTICTFNRARWLRETLAFVTRQDYPADRWEIVVVDNNSSDDTRAVVGSFASAPKPPRYVFEPAQGSSFARNRAIAEASPASDLVIFTDDDMLGGPEWLREIVEPFTRAGNERVGAVAGDVIPVFPEGLPAWLDKQWEPLAFRADVGPLKPSQLPMTANLALRAGVLREIGDFRTDLGRFGHRLTGGEDHELARRIWGAGYTIWYSPPAGLKHQIAANRLTFKYAFKMAFDSSRSRVIEKTTEPGHGAGWLLSRLVTYTLQVLWCLAGSLLSLIIFQFGWSKRWLTRAAKGAGYLVECGCAIGRKLRGVPPPA